MFWLNAPQTVMKAAPFEYFRVGAVDEACAMLAADENARVIAGGQTLVPMMVMRLARPTRLVDINRIAELSYIRSDGDVISIGATTRQCLVERDPRIAVNLPQAERDRLRAEGQLAGIGVAACLEPSGGNASFEPLLNPKNATTTWMDSCRIDVDLTAAITATMHTSSAGARP